MTEQLFVFRCADVRKYAFDHRRGDLQEMELRKFEKHLSACEACQAYYARLDGLLDAALLREVPAQSARDEIFANIVQRVQPGESAQSDADVKDALFDKIAAEIARPPVAAEALALAEPEYEEDDAANDNRTRRASRIFAVAALAAGVAIGFAVRALVVNEVAPPHREVAEVAQQAPAPTTQPPEPPALLAELWPQPAPAGIDNVHVFGTNDASWTLKAQGAGRTMALDAGTVLVEFVPQRRSTLNVVGHGFTVEVTGTIFYVSANPTTVGVVEGSVTVHGGEKSVRLTAGDAWTPEAGKHVAPPAMRADAERVINIDEHVDALARAALDRVVEEPPRPALSKEVVQTPREQLRAAAEDALRAGRYAIAAQFYERMVAELPATLPENASLRLDLARIYIRHLGQEERAISHLRRFVGDRPDDPLTPTARDELCRIARLGGVQERGCP